MNKILQINSSIFASGGQSTQLADAFVQGYKEKHSDTEVRVLDLANNPVPHLDGDRFQALITSPEERTAQQAAIVDEADALLNDVREASAIVLALPMYNFGVPSVLKAYFDHLARAGESFAYTENGPVGLLEDRPVYIFAARGGEYKGTPMDTQTDYVIHFLAFLGLKNVKFVYAEGLNMGDEPKEQALSAAHEEIKSLLA